MPRLGVYTDYTYSLVDGRPYAERAFAIFIAELAHRPRPGRRDRQGSAPTAESRYPLGDVDFVALPHYPSLSHFWPAIRGMLGSLRPFWRALDELDCVWILGPHPLAFPFALMARLRGRRVFLGVRQDSVAYVRSRHPGSRLHIALVRAMDRAFRALARRWPTIVVGPALARQYAHGGSLLDLSISLIRASDISDEVRRDYSGDLIALSVGRLESEKNPLALADVIAALRRLDPRWRLVVCGEGDLRGALEERIEELGVADAVEVRGYVPHDAGLAEAYREAHALAHVTWTEGLPRSSTRRSRRGCPWSRPTSAGSGRRWGTRRSWCLPGILRGSRRGWPVVGLPNRP